MGLFDKIMGNNSDEEKSKDNQEEFKSMIVESENIPREIKGIAIAHNLPLRELDFKIIKIKTSYILGKEEGWIEADKAKLDQFKDKDFLLDSNLKIKQIYKVDIFKIQKDEHTPVLPEIVLSGNKSLTKIIVTIKKDLEVKYFSKIENRIIEEINKKKIRAGILISLHDEKMYKEVKKVVSEIRVNGILDKDSVFVACQGIDIVPPINDKFEFHYKKNLSKEDEHGRVDYSKRGYILAVSKGDCIIEYTKPQFGVAGRNCKGKYLAVEEPESDHEMLINHTESIIKKEDDERIKYVANKNGYVTEDTPGSYDIKEDMDVDEVSFKTTGSIETEMSANVKINIKEDDALKDAIGPGMSVETYELNIQGNVASGAKLKTEILIVGGQTHQTSIMESKKATIATHRGTITADEVEIGRLEGGTIIGNTVNIKQASGGEVIGKNVIIEELSSNVSITASDTIEIKNLKGSNNKFLIDPTMTKEFNENISKINGEIKDLTLKLKIIPKQLEERQRVVRKNKPTVNLVKEKIIELKNEGKEAPSTLLAKVKEFQKSVVDYNEFLKKYKDDKLKLKNLKEDLDQVQMKVFSAKIINHSPWKEYNEIKFKLISPDIEKVYNTKEHEIIREISLKETSEGTYEINRSSEYSS
ncbi:flagellar assembly protein A [Sulfurospirillum arcachonense]|uniref:flagellar assembly protein A n=1 Tax=Sulfurospirillum arcachonense TaxID=57666 RepID=UPI000468007B|nr:flagellar assembly protein A [Sulfurospirillum arcachonense]